MAAPDRSQFVQGLLPLAQQWEQRTGIPASMWLAMAASESNWGAAGNSLFGIKGSGNAGSLNSPTWEMVNGQPVQTSDNFAAYQSPNDAFAAFWNLVSTSPRYAQAMARLRAGDTQGFLQGINQAGYATDPQWADKIQSLADNTISPMVDQTMGTMQDSQRPDNSGSTNPATNQTTSQPSALDQEVTTVGQQIAQLRKASTETDQNGDPTAAAFLAQKQLTSLESEYRSLLIAQAQQSHKASGVQPVIKWDSSLGSYVSIDPATGQSTPIAGTDSGIPVTSPDPMNPGQTITTYETPAQYSAETQRKAQENAQTQQQWDNWYKQQQAGIQNDLAAGRLSLDQAIAKANEAHMIAQDNIASQRNQIDWANSQLGFAQNIASDSARMAESMLPYIAPKGTAAALNAGWNAAQTGGHINVNLPSAPLPFDPQTFAQQVALTALKNISPMASSLLNNQPAQPSLTTPATPVTTTAAAQPTTPYVTPNNESGAGMAPPVFTNPYQPNGPAGPNALIQAGVR